MLCSPPISSTYDASHDESPVANSPVVNAGLGAVLAGALFANHDAVKVAPALYTFGCMLTGTILASYWSMSGRADTLSESEPHFDNGNLPGEIDD